VGMEQVASSVLMTSSERKTKGVSVDLNHMPLVEEIRSLVLTLGVEEEVTIMTIMSSIENNISVGLVVMKLVLAVNDVALSRNEWGI